MPNWCAVERSPLRLKRSATPITELFAGILVFVSAVRTSARVAVPFLHALSYAAATTCVAAYVGAPKYMPFPPCDFLNALMIADFGFTGKLGSWTFDPTPR